MSTPKVYAAISAVAADLAKSGISKDDTNTYDNYKFRGIDAVYNHIASLLPKHGLLILPRYTERQVVERVGAKGTALFYVTVRGECDFVSVEDGTTHTVIMYGEAMDRGDKATNKAMSAAYKYACFQTFCIPTEGDNDADAQSHEVQPIKADADAIAAIKAGLEETQSDVGAFLGWLRVSSVEELTPQQAQTALAALAKKKAQAA